MKTPSHYEGKVQPIDLIDAHDLNFNRGNVVKYVCRAGRKGDALEDLQKALYYLNREIEKQKTQNDAILDALRHRLGNS